MERDKRHQKVEIEIESERRNLIFHLGEKRIHRKTRRLSFFLISPFKLAEKRKEERRSASRQAFCVFTEKKKTQQEVRIVSLPNLRT